MPAINGGFHRRPTCVGFLSSASNSVVGSANLVKKVYFPRLVVPISSVVSGTVDFCLAMIVLFIMLVCYRVTPTWSIVWLPLLLLPPKNNVAAVDARPRMGRRRPRLPPVGAVVEVPLVAVHGVHGDPEAAQAADDAQGSVTEAVPEQDDGHGRVNRREGPLPTPTVAGGARCGCQGPHVVHPGLEVATASVAR